MTRNLVLVGAGLHAQHSYLSMLRDRIGRAEVRLFAVVDVADRRAQVLETLRRCGVQAVHVITEDADAAGARRNGLGLARLEQLSRQHRIDGVIAATDPRGHRGILEWAARHDIDTLVDKPLTAHEMHFTDESAANLVGDHEHLVKLFADGAASATVMVPRRLHPGYAFVREILLVSVAQLGLPVTYLDLYHSSGYWNLPDEFLTRENHPYRYGYGALLHSGYHFVDLAAWLLKVNEGSHPDRWADRLEVLTQHATPDDVLEQEPYDFYRRVGLAAGLQSTYGGPERAAAGECGETDAHVSFRALRGNRTLTLGTLRMMETGLSHRAWRALPRDTYKQNGKFSQDRLTVHVGHLLAVHAWESSHGPETPKSFVVEIMRNHRLIGGAGVERRVFEPEPSDGGPVALSVQGKRELFDRWLAGRTAGLTLDTHELTVRLLTAAYTAMFRARRGLPPMSTVTMATDVTQGASWPRP